MTFSDEDQIRFFKNSLILIEVKNSFTFYNKENEKEEKGEEGKNMREYEEERNKKNPRLG